MKRLDAKGCKEHFQQKVKSHVNIVLDYSIFIQYLTGFFPLLRYLKKIHFNLLMNATLCSMAKIQKLEQQLT